MGNVKPKCRLGKRKDKHKNSSRLSGRAKIICFVHVLWALDVSDENSTAMVFRNLPVILHCNECGYARRAPDNTGFFR